MSSNVCINLWFVNGWLVGDIIAVCCSKLFPPKLKECFVGFSPFLFHIHTASMT